MQEGLYIILPTQLKCALNLHLIFIKKCKMGIKPGAYFGALALMLLTKSAKIALFKDAAPTSISLMKMYIRIAQKK